jgi:hypothetical protein
MRTIGNDQFRLNGNREIGILEWPFSAIVTCLAGYRIPDLQNCTGKPNCSSPTVPEHGGINSTASHFYVDDAISFSCDLGYNLEGPTEKQCR